jgi:diguanylate cyclase (GGDEF)-like protein
MELLAKAQSKLLHQAMYDPLTDLPNRKFFQDSLEQILRNKPENCDSQTFRPSFLFIDLDNFKFVNDSQGHQVGDMVLKKVGESLMLAVREGDIVSRIGGDEFAIFLDTTDAPEKLDTILRRILDAVKTPIPLSSHDVVLTASIGVAVYPDHGQTVNELMKNADLAMYEAKNSGRDTYHLFSGELEKRVRVRHDMEKNLREAISREEFCLYYQPKINMRRGEITGFEALLRWPSRNIPPSDFIGVAEESGLIVPIGEWVIETAGIMLDNFSKWGYGSYSLSVNLSVRQFWTVDFIGFLKGVLSRSHFPAHRLELEITESQLMRDTIRSAHFIRELKSMGVSVSVDDFGTGYSSLAYLKNFDLDSLKIDQSFIRDLTHDPSDRLIVRAIIAMAHGMRVGVIAEGVETLEQLAFLQHEHCDELQGFLVSRPLPEEDLLPFIKNYRLVKGALFSD